MSRAPLSWLAPFARRLAVAYESGVDSRAIWARESHHAPPRCRSALATISQEIAAGASFEDAFRAAGPFFPASFIRLFEVGEETGRTPDVLRSLAEHYESLLAMRRDFFRRIAWPAFQLVAALGIIALFILLLGMLGAQVDPLGFGTGVSGVLNFALLIGTIAAVLFALYVALTRGMIPSAPLHSFLLRIPYLGSALRTLAVSQIASVLELTLGAGVEIRRAVDLALASARLHPFTSLAPTVRADLTGNEELYTALAKHSAFPPDFLQAIATGEQSGRIPEVLASYARQNRDRANSALAVLTQVASFAVWMLIILIILLAFILPLINSVLQPYREALDFLQESQGS